MLLVLTGPVRSGKSRCGLQLALASGRPVVVAVGASTDDEEMVRRVQRHRAERPSSVAVVETPGNAEWLSLIPEDACLLVDCLGTVLGAEIAVLVPDDAQTAAGAAEDAAETLADALVTRLLARSGPTVVVTNEVGWGIVPATPLGRLFRDVLARANRRLIDGAAGAWLVIAGRCIDMNSLPQEVSWPKI